MCGICGFNWNDGKLIEKMNDQMPHRGPDQSGVFCDNGISLGHRRLSIIDLSEHGRQPMHNEDKSVWMVFNGEIYNYQELRPILQSKGHIFNSNTDSEVIIHAYEEYGADCLQHLRGMFAIAIFDKRDGSIFLARDRIGIKPLYYFYDGSKLAFASEIKAILECADVPRELNRQALYDYMGFEFVPAPETMFKGINKLPAGHFLRLKGKELTVSEYWQLNMEPPANPPSFDEAVEEVRSQLDFAVKSHLMSDVPLGVFLSGGLDSSAIVAMMRKHISGPLRTFTIGYQDKTFSELPYAEQVAKQFDTEHHVLMIDDMKPEYVEKVLWHLDEPMTDLSTVPLYLVCQQAKKYITVCLSGEGGDESFAGYDRFKASRMNRMYSLIPGPLRKVAASALSHLPDQPQKKGAINMLKRFIEGSSHHKDGQHLRWQYFSNKTQEASLFNDAFRGGVSMDPFRLIREYSAKSNAKDAVNKEVFLDMRFMMTDSVLMKVDKMSMASSMEIRVPLLDHVFVEYIASLHGNWKLKGLTTKHIFRAALQGILPDNIVNRGKQGYSLPVKHLLRNELKNYMIGLIHDSPLIRENMNIAYIDKLIEEHCTLKHNHNHVLWGLINTAIWHNRFIA